MRVILTTVGTSLKGNAEKAGKSPAQLLRENPRAACAEVNVLDRILQPGDTVELFHSQTPDGELCARAIADYIQETGYKVQLTVIDGLTYKAGDFHKGLRSLVRCLSQRLRKTQQEGKTPILNALGGFKSEVVYATLVGALFGIPNVYIHQGFDELLEIPPLPIGWDMAKIDAYADTLQWLDDAPRKQTEAHSRLQVLPADLRDTLTEPGDNDGCVYLSPLGDAFFEAYRARIETATGTIQLSQSAARTYNNMKPSVREMFDRVLQRLRVPEIRRQGSKTLERDKGDVFVFPQGHVNERLFWYEQENIVHVVEMARHDREYNQHYQGGVFCKNYPIENAQPWSL